MFDRTQSGQGSVALLEDAMFLDAVHKMSVCLRRVMVIFKFGLGRGMGCKEGGGQRG